MELLLDQLKGHLSAEFLDVDTWRKIADKRMEKLGEIDKENSEVDEAKGKKCDSEYLKSLSLEKNKLFYQNRRKLSAKNGRSLTKVSSHNSVSFGKYVQSNLR